jgi:hypothetical protein
MKRREFVGLLGSVAVWPFAIRAQQPVTMRRVGVLTGTSQNEPASISRIAALEQGLRQAGWSIGHNILIDVGWTDGDTARLDQRILRTRRALARDHRAKLTPLVLHDIRRTMRTHLSALPIPDFVRELVIGHAKPDLHGVFLSFNFQRNLQPFYSLRCRRR